jgi:hypothetical protein
MIIYYYFFARRKNLIQKYFPRRPIKRLANALHWIKAFLLNYILIDELLHLYHFKNEQHFVIILTHCWYRFQSILLCVTGSRNSFQCTKMTQLMRVREGKIAICVTDQMSLEDLDPTWTQMVAFPIRKLCNFLSRRDTTRRGQPLQTNLGLGSYRRHLS